MFHIKQCLSHGLPGTRVSSLRMLSQNTNGAGRQVVDLPVLLLINCDIGDFAERLAAGVIDTNTLARESEYYCILLDQFGTRNFPEIDLISIDRKYLRRFSR